ncbi:MAG: hypothetical protein OMM_08984 [Candidatus Magnetoglobus multicellularis str. Araruama]|uniref:Uncharacterized protein n=1 Tax=Candidatus Magnetoglobus multicellularis str. Araruama TaxID=890399 RepID=A0A1V1P632_9BACT|nr:MAG: hypothetical protein OMM_08984 [Candidatus Magnetoglobus multicellularis str. Araruama]
MKKISDKNQLNKSKIRTLLDIKNESKNAFQYLINANTSVSDIENKEAQQSSTDDDRVSLANMSAKKIKQFADKIIRKEEKPLYIILMKQYFLKTPSFSLKGLIMIILVVGMSCII